MTTLAAWTARPTRVGAISCCITPELSVVASPSVPSIVFEDESIAIVAKPAATNEAALGAWARDTLTGDDLYFDVALLGAIGGLVPVAKTDTAAACLRSEALKCEYVAIVRGAPDKHDHDVLSCGSLQLDWFATSRGTPDKGRGFVHERSLSLVGITAAGSLDSTAICNEFSALGLCVLGAVAAVPGQKVRRGREAKREMSAKQTD
eukprot:4137989-Prymnesium_polylepis.1